MLLVHMATWYTEGTDGVAISMFKAQISSHPVSIH